METLKKRNAGRHLGDKMQRMFRQGMSGVLVLCMLLCVLTVHAQEDAFRLLPVTEEIRPGQAVMIEYELPEDTTAGLTLRASEDSDEVLSVIASEFTGYAGRGGLWWNGTYEGTPAPEGDAFLVLETTYGTVSTPVSIGPALPVIESAESSTATLSPGERLEIEAEVTTAGSLTLVLHHENGDVATVSSGCTAGIGTVDWTPDGMPDGQVAVTLTLTDADGVTSEPWRTVVMLEGFGDETAAEAAEETLDPALLEMEEEPEDTEDGTVEETGTDEAVMATDEDLTVHDWEEEDQSIYTPNWGSPYYGQDETLNYWTLPMDITDEEAVWKVLTSPITVLDTGKNKAERTQITVRKEPSLEAEGVGVVTCVSQGIHVLETLDNGWSKIEAYSSSFHNSKVKAWNMLVQGYVETKYIKTTTPNQHYGYVVDKLTQRLYVFKDGKMISELLVSTGLSNERQPYNETRSGEFLLLTPAVGEFRSDNLYCAMAIRFDNGDLLHEVPHTLNRDGSNNYKNTEPKLGTRASHGCIRVQRKKTPEGINMRWIWDNRKANTRLLIWEDWQGRQIPVPDDDLVLYYNPNGGEMYHRADNCYSAQGRTFTAFTYGQLEEEPFASLICCDYCNPAMRREDIQAVNTLHAPGGDHDPVLTEARRKLGLVE